MMTMKIWNTVYEAEALGYWIVNGLVKRRGH